MSDRSCKGGSSNAAVDNRTPHCFHSGCVDYCKYKHYVHFYSEDKKLILM